MSRRILIVDDDPEIRSTLEFHLTASGYEVETVASAEASFARVHAFRPQVVITDLQMPGMSGMELLGTLKAAADIEVIMITGHEDMQSAVTSIRMGAYDYLAKPVDAEALDAVLGRCFRDLAARRRVDGASAPEGAEAAGNCLVGTSPQMLEVYKTLGLVAGTRAPVLIRGETGTGKEMIARAIHDNSENAHEPFIAINCTAIPETLLESELFGHVKGAFTGAVNDRKGRFEQAGKGTIFLDEIGDTPPSFQTKLLRVLQEHEFYPVGGERPRRTEARVIAATHRPIEKLIRKGDFREDLYFRLRVVELRVPPLRERVQDIPRLSEHLLAKASREMHKEVRLIPPEAMRRLEEYDWPGNVRELENAIARAVVMAHGPILLPEHLGLGQARQRAGVTDAGESLSASSLEATERKKVEATLDRTHGNKRQAARILGISRPRLDRLVVKYGIDVQRLAQAV